MTVHSKTSVNQDLILAARTGLLPVSERTWLGGFGNMFRKELNQWWGTRTWWVQILLWVLIINGITTIVMSTEGGYNMGILEAGMPVFTGLATAVVAIGTVTGVQNAIVGEKQLGTAAWVLSKPTSRSAFLLAKMLSYIIGFWVTAIIVPAVIFYLETRFIFHTPVPILSFMAALDVIELIQLFYLSLTLMLGTLTSSRGAIAGIGMGILLGGAALTQLVPSAYLVTTPWLLPDIASGLALGQPLPSIWFIPIVATAIEVIIMIAVTFIRFQKEEF